MKVEELMERSNKENDLNDLEGFAARMKTREDMTKFQDMLKAFDKKHGKMGDRVHDIVNVMKKRARKYNLLDY